jgi:flagellar protein FliS
MANPAFNPYLEMEVLEAEPLKLVQMLYRAAIDAVAEARRHVVARNIGERSREITRAMGIVNQLMFSLDHAAGGEISRNLGGLYAYVQSRLLAANAQQIEAPLAEVEKLLTTLFEGWCDAAVCPVPDAASSENEPVSSTY